MTVLETSPPTPRRPAETPPAPLSIAPRGSTVEVCFFDRPPLFGFVDIFDPQSPDFFVRKKAENVHLKQVVPFERVRHVAFLRRAGAKAPTNCASTARLIEVRLLDGGTLRGITHSHGGQRRGLFMMPTGIPGIERFYVPASAIQEVMSVRTLGDLLCGRGPATPATIEAALQRERVSALRRAPAAANGDRAAPRAAKPKLGEILLDQGFITSDDLGGALEAQASQRGRRLGELLIDLGLVSHKMVAIGLAIQHGVPFLSLAGRSFEPALRDLVPAELARRLQVVPLAQDGERLRVAIADPGDRGFAEELRRATGFDVEAVVAIPQEIARVQEELYGP
jgi:hypothetical protein